MAENKEQSFITWIELLKGVPQGSVLGRLLFNPLRTIGLIRPKNIFLLKMDKYGLKSYSFYFFV